MEWLVSSWATEAADSGIGWSERQDIIPVCCTSSPSAKVAKEVFRIALGPPGKWELVHVIITTIWASNVCPSIPKLWAIGEAYTSIMRHPQRLWAGIISFMRPNRSHV